MVWNKKDNNIEGVMFANNGLGGEEIDIFSFRH